MPKVYTGDDCPSSETDSVTIIANSPVDCAAPDATPGLLVAPPWKSAALGPIFSLNPSPWSACEESHGSHGDVSFFSQALPSRKEAERRGASSGSSTPTWPGPVDQYETKGVPADADAFAVAEQMRMEGLTTVMLRNVHNRVGAEQFAETLDSLGFESQYDLCLIPTDPNSGRGKGYGFVNFTAPEVAAHFCEIAETIAFERASGKRLQVAVARLQGVELTLQNRTKKAKKKSRAGSIVVSASPA